MRPQPALRMCGTAARDIIKAPLALTPIVRSQAATGTFSISLRSAPCGAPALLTRMSRRPYCAITSSTMRLASSSRLTSPRVAEATPPVALICSTSVSTPPQFASVSSGALNSFATPVARRSDTTTATPLAASARAVELPMPMGLPQPVIRATRVGWGMESSLCCVAPLPHRGRGRGLARKRWEGEGLLVAGTLTRLALRATLSRSAGEGHWGCLHRLRPLQLRPVHQAARRRIERVPAVHRAAIVPPNQIPAPPFLLPGEFFLLGVLPQEIEQ